MNKESFVFYGSFYESISLLDDALQLEMYQCLTEYGLTGQIREDVSPVAKALLVSMKPMIDRANKRYQSKIENGKKGGRPKKEENTVNTEVDHQEAHQNTEKPQKKQNKKRTNNDVSDKKEKSSSIGYIAELLNKKGLLEEGEINLVDDTVKEYQQAGFSAIDIKVKAEYILEAMRNKNVDDRMSYFSKSMNKNMYGIFKKTNNAISAKTVPKADENALAMLEKYD